MSIDGTRKTSTSTHSIYKFVPNFKTKSSSFSILIFCFALSIAGLSFTNAQPYKTNVNDINWARFVAPSPLEMSSNSVTQYEGDEEPENDDLMEQESDTGNNNDVSKFEWGHNGTCESLVVLWMNDEYENIN